MEHTKGPWTFNQLHPLTVEAPPRRIAMIYAHNGPNGKAMEYANARLIAAAPEMLEMLKDVEHWLNIHLQRGQINAGTANRDGDLVSQLRAAIAKAEGK